MNWITTTAAAKELNITPRYMRMMCAGKRPRISQIKRVHRKGGRWKVKLTASLHSVENATTLQ
jgi:hypothetical protein